MPVYVTHLAIVAQGQFEVVRRSVGRWIDIGYAPYVFSSVATVGFLLDLVATVHDVLERFGFFP